MEGDPGRGVQRELQQEGTGDLERKSPQEGGVVGPLRNECYRGTTKEDFSFQELAISVEETMSGLCAFKSRGERGEGTFKVASTRRKRERGPKGVNPLVSFLSGVSH